MTELIPGTKVSIGDTSMVVKEVTYPNKKGEHTEVLLVSEKASEAADDEAALSGITWTFTEAGAAALEESLLEVALRHEIQVYSMVFSQRKPVWYQGSAKAGWRYYVLMQVPGAFPGQGSAKKLDKAVRRALRDIDKNLIAEGEEPYLLV